MEEIQMKQWVSITIIILVLLAIIGSCSDNSSKVNKYPKTHEDYIREQNNKWSSEVKESLRRQGYGN